MCSQVLIVRRSKFHMHAMMQTRMQKVEKFFVFFSTKLGLLQGGTEGFRAAVGFARPISLHPARWSGCVKYTARDASILSTLTSLFTTPGIIARLLERCF